VTAEGTLRNRLQESAVGGGLPCAVAHRLATSCATLPRVVGETANGLGLRITYCQLGLFGYGAFGEKRWTRRLTTIPTELEREVHRVRVDGQLSCVEAWRWADERGLPRLLFGSVAETLDVRISDCQLGCF
jgi:hypothetical protein